MLNNLNPQLFQSPVLYVWGLNFVITVPADVLAPNDATAGTVLTA